MENQAIGLIRECEALRARGALSKAIALIEDNIDNIEPAYQPLAWYQAFRLAREKGSTEQAKHFAMHFQSSGGVRDEQNWQQRLSDLLNLGEDEVLQFVEQDRSEGEAIIQRSALLRSRKLYDEAIELIERNIDRIHREQHARAWYEAFYAARAKGDTQLAMRFVIAISEADPNALNG